MERTDVTYEGKSMRDVVSADKADLMNSGVIKTADAQSVSTLSEKKSAAARRATATQSKHRAANVEGATAKSNDKASWQGHRPTETSEKESEDVRAMAEQKSKARIIKAGAANAAAGIVAGQVEQAPEFEGASDLRGNALKAKRAASAIKKAAAKSNGAALQQSASSSGKSARAVRKATREAKAGKTAHAQAAGQAKAAQAAQGARSATAVKEASSKTIGAAVSSAAAPAAGILTGVLAFILAALVITQIASALFGFWENESLKDTGSLTGVEQEIAACLKEYGFSDEATAAVLGNLKAESGMNPSSDEVMDGMFNYAYERACGLFQYTSTSPGTGEYWSFKRWCENAGKAWSDVRSQMEWTFSGNCEGTWSNRWSTALARSGYYSNCPGYTNCGYHESSEFAVSDDVVKATFSWMACYERPANGSYAHLDNRIGYAQEYLAKLTASAYTGNNAIVKAAYSQLGVPYVWGGSTPGVGLDCSGLTQYCYAQAGIRISHYTETQYSELTPIPLSQAKPGDILYRNGHVAIFIGGENNDQYIHEPQAGDVCKISTGINYFTCALRHT